MNNKFREKKLKSSHISVKPYIYNIPSISSVTIRLLILLGIQVLMLIISGSLNALLVVLTALSGALFAALINYFVRKEAVYNIMNIVMQGLLFGLLIPENYPPVTVFVISFATMLISRSIVFKGINGWVNAPAIAVIIAWSIGNIYFPQFAVNSELLSTRNSSVYLIQSGYFPIYSFDSPVTAYLNKYIFSLLNVSVPEGFVSLLWDTNSIIPAFRFNLITIISSIIIFSDNAFSLIIPTVFLTVYGILVRIFVPFLFGGDLNQGDIILAFLTSGVLFCAVFLIQWYGTIPISVSGKITLGLLTGIVAFAIIGCGTSPVGMAYTIICSNIICMIIRIFEEKQNEILTCKVVSKYSAKLAVESGERK